MICAECSAAVEDDAHYCPRCGCATPTGGTIEPTILSDLPGVTLTRAGAAPVVTTLTEQETDTLLARANLHRVRKQWSEAVDCCIAILRSHPGNHTAHSLLGDVYRDQGKLDDAAQWYRMAVDLWANPSDADKLSQVEQERARRAGMQDARALIGRSRMLPMSASGLLGSGTTNLMGGVSPRRWLRAITAVSVGFMGLLIVAVVGSQMQHRAPNAGQAVSNTAAMSKSFTPGKLSSVSSSFVPLPNSFTAAPARSVMTMQSPLPHALSMPAALPPVSQIPLAPVTAIEPDPPAQTLAGAAVRSDGSEAANAHVSPLSGGIHTLQANHGNGGGSASVLLGIPSVNTADSQLEARLVRNVFRAARAEMNVDPSVTHVTVSVQPDNAPGQYVVVADLDRTNVYQANIDSESLGSLEQRLSSVNWWVGQNAGGTSNQETAADSGSETQ